MNASALKRFQGAKHNRHKSGRTRSAKKQCGHRTKLDTWVAASFLIFLFLFGGTSQDIPRLFLLIETVSLIAIAFGVWRLSDGDRALVRPFAIAGFLLISLPALQIVPLPPEAWAALPGRELYMPALRDVGLDDSWRPISLSPNRTLASLLALLPVLAAALLFAPLDVQGRTRLLDVLLVCLLASSLVAVCQITIQAPYFYGVTNRGSGVGFFSNRNHQALFVAIGIVLVMSRWRLAEFGNHRMEIGAIAAGALFLILPLLLMTGSRSGLLTGALALIGGGIIFLRHVLMRQSSKWRWAIIGLALVLAVATLGLALFSFRLTALDRLLASDASDLRVVNLPAMLAATQTFFPFGSGFGTFDPVFRQFEPYDSLGPAFFNHAHNDLLEIILEGGIFALALLAAMGFMMVRRARILWCPVAGSARRVLAKAGYLGLLLLGVGSLVDYPLRTPFLGALAMLLAIWCFASEEQSATSLGTR